MTRRLAVAPDAPRRAGAYVRVSAVMGRGGEDFLSPTIQLDTIKAAVGREPAPTVLVEAWEDIDRSGRTMARPGLAAAMEAARDRRIDVLYVFDLSRWARNAADGLAELAAIEHLGVPVVSATEGNVDRSTTSGRLTAGLMLLLAEHKSDMIGDQWRRVVTTNAERGVLHGPAPLGYIRVDKRTIEIDPLLGPPMAEAFRRYAAGTHSIRALSLWLAKHRGRAISPNMMRNALRSPVYLGKVRLRGNVYDGRHPALIDADVWHDVQRRLDRSAVTPSRTVEATHALAGLARCGECGGTLCCRQRYGRTAKYGPYLACRARLEDGTSTCPGIGTASSAEVEKVVLGWLRREVVDVPDQSAAIATHRARQARARVDLTQLLDEIGRSEKALGELAVKLATGILSDTAYRMASSQIEDSLTRLRTQVAVVDLPAAAPTFVAAQETAAALLDLWPQMTGKERSAALATHVREVRVKRAQGYRQLVADRVVVVPL